MTARPRAKAPPITRTRRPAQENAMRCRCCGSDQIGQRPVLWKELTDQWGLAPHEIAYIERQQGAHCQACGSNLRSMALAHALLACLGFRGVLSDFVRSDLAAPLRVLEINEAGDLTQFLRQLPRHVLVRYPEADMLNLAFPDLAFDLVVHSDTLEHVPSPIRGLAECFRVLRPGGLCAFTVPMVVDRLTLSREGLPPSYHGSPDNPGDCLVRTEYGADAWKHVFLAGFGECRLFTIEFPTAQALVGVRSPQAD
jgi:SAM-dependent methyltransferase